MSVLKKIFGDEQKKKIKQLESKADKVLALEEEYKNGICDNCDPHGLRFSPKFKTSIQSFSY